MTILEKNNLDTIKKNLKAEREVVNTSPTEGQIKAGNYRMGHIYFNGFAITIENPRMSYRKGVDGNGKPWKVLMHNDYGYFTGTVGKDGDAIDVFIGNNPDSDKIYVVDQYINGEFDESKVMFGFNSKQEAKDAYFSNYEKGWKGFKKITGTSLGTFKKWLYDGCRQRKAFYLYKEIENNTIKESIMRDIIIDLVKNNG